MRLSPLCALPLLLLPAGALADGPDDPTTPAVDDVTAPDTEPAEPRPPRDPPLPITQWQVELALTDEQVEQLQPIDTWYRRQRKELREAQGSGATGFRAIRERSRQLQDALRQRLAEVLTPAQLDQVDLEALFEREIPPLLISTTGRARLAFPGRFDDGGGDVTVTTYLGEVQARIALSKRVALTFGISGGAARYDFDDAVELDPLQGDPFDELYTARVSVGFSWQITRAWSAFATTYVAATGERDAEFDDSLTFGGVAGVAYAFNDNFSLGLGALVRTQLEDDPLILPLPIIRLRLDLSEAWRLTIGVPDGLRLTFAPLDELEISLGSGLTGLVTLPDARLDDEDFAPEGVFRQTQLPITLVVDWRPLPFLKLSFEGGLIVYRKYEIDDARGNSLTDVHTDPTGYVQLGLNLVF